MPPAPTTQPSAQAAATTEAPAQPAPEATPDATPPRPCAEPGAGRPDTASKELLLSVMRLARALKHTQTLEVEPAQAFVIHTLRANGPLRLSDLAGQVRLDVSTVSRHVRTLEQLGYVARADDPDDRRAFLLSASPDGCRVLDRHFAASRERIAHILRDWSDEDVHVLQVMLARLTHDIERAQTETATR